MLNYSVAELRLFKNVKEKTPIIQPFPSSPPRSHSPFRYSRAIATNHAFLCHVIQQGDVEFQKPFML